MLRPIVPLVLAALAATPTLRAAEGDDPSRQGLSALQRQDWRAVGDSALVLITVAPEDPLGYYLFAHSSARERRWDEVREALLVSLDLKLPAAQVPAALLLLYHAEEQLGDAEGARATAARLLVEHAGSPEAATLKAALEGGTPPAAAPAEGDAPAAAPDPDAGAAARCFMDASCALGHDSNPVRLREVPGTEESVPPSVTLPFWNSSLPDPLGRRIEDVVNGFLTRRYDAWLAETTRKPPEPDSYLLSRLDLAATSAAGDLQAGLEGTWLDYHHEDQLDFISVAPWLLVGSDLGWDDRLEAELRGGYDWLDHESYATWGDLAVTWEHHLGAGWSTRVTPELRSTHHRQDADEGLDGLRYGCEVQLRWKRRRAIYVPKIRLEVGVADRDYDEDHRAWFGADGRLVVDLLAVDGWRVTAEVFGETRSYHEADPATDDPERRDRFAEVLLAVEAPLWAGFSLAAEGRLQRNWSNLDDKDYERWAVQGGVRWSY